MPKSVVVSTCLILGILLLEICSTGALWCDRNPPGVNVPRTTGDHGFKIVISGDPDKPDKYIPGAQYTGTCVILFCFHFQCVKKVFLPRQVKCMVKVFEKGLLQIYYVLVVAQAREPNYYFLSG